MTTNSQNDDDLDPETLEGFCVHVEKMDRIIDCTLSLILGDNPGWMAPYLNNFRDIIEELLQFGLTGDQIAQHVKEAEIDELTFPGVLADRESKYFAKYIYQLAHLVYCARLGEDVGLEKLAGADAAKGAMFSRRHRKGALTRVNKYLVRLLELYPNLTYKEVFKIACDQADKEGSPFQYDTVSGSLYEKDGGAEITLAQFSNRISKQKIKKEKIGI